MLISAKEKGEKRKETLLQQQHTLFQLEIAKIIVYCTFFLRIRKKNTSGKGYMPVQSLQPFQMPFFFTWRSGEQKKKRPCPKEAKNIDPLGRGVGLFFRMVDTV